MIANRFLFFLFFAHGLAAECVGPQLGLQQAAARLKDLEKRAQAEMQRRSFAQAAATFKEATCLAPKEARYYYGLGVAEAGAGDLAQAREALEKAGRLSPDNALPLAMLVKVTAALGDVEGAKGHLRSAARRFPKADKLHAQLARELLEQQQYDLALAECLRAEQGGQRDPEILLMMATLENTAGAYGDAIRHALEVLKEAEAPMRMGASAAGVAGLSYASLGEAEQAITHLNLAIQLAPDQENSYLALAHVHEKAQNYRASAEVLERGRAKFPQSPGLLLALGSNLVSAGEYEHGIRVLAEVTEKFPDQFEAYVQLAEGCRKSGEPVLATRALRRLAKRKPDYPMLHILIAQSLLAESAVNYQQVLEELAQAEKIVPTDFDVYYLRGKAYGAMNQYGKAVTALRRAIELRPSETSAYYQLGLTYQKMGQPELAREQMQRMQFLTGSPGSP